MKTLEEQLWDYIDGNATAGEQANIKLLLAKDAEANGLYKQLLELNAHFNSIDIDEPSMSFTRNVMEQVALEIPPVALKTKTDRRIILFISFFFIATLLAVFVYAIANSKTDIDFSLPDYSMKFHIEKYFNATTLKIFLLADVIIALVYFDSILRRRMHKKDPLL